MALKIFSHGTGQKWEACCEWEQLSKSAPGHRSAERAALDMETSGLEKLHYTRPKRLGQIN